MKPFNEVHNCFSNPGGSCAWEMSIYNINTITFPLLSKRTFFPLLSHILHCSNENSPNEKRFLEQRHFLSYEKWGKSKNREREVWGEVVPPLPLFISAFAPVFAQPIHTQEKRWLHRLRWKNNTAFRLSVGIKKIHFNEFMVV